MRKRGTIAALCIAAASLAAVFLISAAWHDGAAAQLPKSFSIGNRSFSFSSYAVTEQQRERGLMNSTVTDSTIMLFVFPDSGVYSFWMRDTYGSLDIIWVSTGANPLSGRVVYLVSGAPPCPSGNCTIYTPDLPADYVIEAKAGFAAEHGIAVGSVIRFNS